MHCQLPVADMGHTPSVCFYHISIRYKPILPSIIALLLQQDDIGFTEVVDEGMMLLNCQGQDHGSSGLKNVGIKAVVELLVRVLHSIGNTTMKKCLR